ncbi:MAG: complex I NDUFA9 subunit family protein [Rhodobacteraceae bacterium]|nr:complex I NDUFA9 subunit family protein [Paracoccaceae bacterium]
MADQMVIFGGTGFVGRSIAEAALGTGFEVRLASRSGESFAGAKGVVCNITDEAQVAAALEGATVAVNCVGILAPGKGGNGFEALQAEGAERIARLSAAAGVNRMVQVSAIGADAGSDSLYQRTKAKGEAGVLAHMPNALILRPSIVFGPGDSFFNRFAGMSKLSPVVPVVGAGTRFQPIFVGDIAAAVIAGIAQGAEGVHELGGPEVESFADLMHRMLGVLERKRLVLSLPTPIGMVMGASFETLSALTGGALEPQITRDQVKNLGEDNVVSGAFPGLEALGVTPTPMADVMPTYLS